MPDIPFLIIELIQRVDRNIDFYRSPSYKEAQLRNEFVNPFFEALGWDFHSVKINPKSAWTSSMRMR